MQSCIKLISARPLSNDTNDSYAPKQPTISENPPGPVTTAKTNNAVTFPPLGYKPTPVNALLANALDLTAPASDALLKNRKNAWIQLAGHPGFFAPAGLKTIWKRQPNGDRTETKTYCALMNDAVRNFVPGFIREVVYNSETFIEIEDLLQKFHDPNIMDIKMGTRTFLESEVKNPALRSDLFEKMIKIDANAPTAEEKENKAVTKLRYMQFREGESSSSTYGFRIEAIRISGESPCTNLKKVKTKEEVKNTISKFVRYNRSVCQRLLQRLQDIRNQFKVSKFFRNHELIGSSLLVLYDDEDNVGIWMIDFAKALIVPDRKLSHRIEWKPGNHEDGYLVGLDSLILIMKELSIDCRPPPPPQDVATTGSPVIECIAKV